MNNAEGICMALVPAIFYLSDVIYYIWWKIGCQQKSPSEISDGDFDPKNKKDNALYSSRSIGKLFEKLTVNNIVISHR